MLPILVVAVPLLTAFGCAVSKRPHHRELVHLLGSVVSIAATLWLVWKVTVFGAYFALGQFFFIDSLSALILLITGIVSFTAALHSIGYIRQELQSGELKDAQTRSYYAWFHGFVAAMYFVPMVNNLGIAWVAIEATTITSAYLVALYRNAEALEAAWKYLILCSVGIAFALLGLIVLYGSSINVYGSANNRLDFTFLYQAARPLPMHLLLLAFVLVLVGYGTKVGLAPMHFWLPDAHSQAPSPISAMLSGALLSTALYGILRIVIIVDRAGGGSFVSHVTLAFGLLSLVVAFPFLLLQHDIKRMLAFSSVEQMGILVFGIGIGGPAGLLAVVLQMFNHAMTKSTLFMTAGNFVQHYGTKNMRRMGGGLRRFPFTGTVFLIATVALVGAPPFALFTSEFALAAAGFANNHAIVTIIFLLLLAAMFGVVIYQAGRVLFGKAPGHERHVATDPWTTWPLLIPLSFVVVLGVFIPHSLQLLFHQAALVLGGRMP